MTDIRWRGTSHEELYRMINSGEGPRASASQLDYWARVDRQFADIHQRLTEKLGTLNGGWQGEAGMRAQEALGPLRRWAEDVHGHVNGMRGVAQNQADLIADARARMPEPRPAQAPQPAGWPAPGEAPSPGRSPAGMIALHGTDMEPQEAAAADAREQAIRVMSNYERNSEVNRGSLGVFEEPGRVAVEVPEPADTSVPVGYRPGPLPVEARPVPSGGPPGGGMSGPPEGAVPGGSPRQGPGAPDGRIPGEPPAGGVVERPVPPGTGPGGFRVPAAPARPVPPPPAPEPPGALTGTVGTAGGLGAIVAGGAGGPGRRGGGAHRKREGDAPENAPQWPGEQDNPETGDAAPSGGPQHGLPQHGGGQPSTGGGAGQVPQPQPGGHHADPLQPAQHAGVSLEGTQPGQSGPTVDPVQPVHSQPVAPAPAAEASVVQSHAYQPLMQQGPHNGAAPIAPMAGGGAAPGAQGPAMRGQSPLMRQATAGNQAFFGNGSGGPAAYGSGYGTSAQSASGAYGGPPAGAAPAGGAGYSQGGTQHTSYGYTGQGPVGEPEPEPGLPGEFSEPVSADTDPFWEDDRRVAPPVLGEFPQQ